MARWLAIFLLVTVWGGSLGAIEPLTPGFEVFRLGMSLDELKTALSTSTYFLYTGDPDVTLLNRPNTNLIDVPGLTYFHRGVFQIVDGKLYSIALEVNPEKVSYFDLFTSLTKKYGDPTGLDPSAARWESDAVRLTLEKPLTVKYVDMVTFLRIQKTGKSDQAMETLTRQKFLETF